jgi:4-aminobutyrate aminotransferase / (S)-3-amino-2-methylpropionate transaminase / 5-aminovalerate transaminase
LLERADHIGGQMLERLRGMADRFASIGDVRGRGAMVAMELVEDRETKAPAKQAASRLIEECYRQGVVILKAGTFDNVIRLLPPLTIDDGLLAEGLEVVEKALAAVEEQA